MSKTLSDDQVNTVLKCLRYIGKEMLRDSPPAGEAAKEIVELMKELRTKDKNAKS